MDTSSELVRVLVEERDSLLEELAAAQSELRSFAEAVSQLEPILREERDAIADQLADAQAELRRLRGEPDAVPEHAPAESAAAYRARLACCEADNAALTSELEAAVAQRDAALAQALRAEREATQSRAQAARFEERAVEAVLAESEAARQEAALLLLGGSGGSRELSAEAEAAELRQKLAEVAELMPALEELRRQRDELETHNQELFSQLAASSDCLQREAAVSREARRAQSESEARWKVERGMLLDTATRLRAQLRTALLANEGPLFRTNRTEDLHIS